MDKFICDLFSMHIRPGATVIDPFVSDGRVLLAASESNRSAVGIFSSQKNITEYRSSCRANGLKEQVFIFSTGNALETEYPNGCADCVFTCGIQDHETLFRTCTCKVKINGLLIIVARDGSVNNRLVPCIPLACEYARLFDFELIDLRVNPLKNAGVGHEYAMVFKRIVGKNVLTPNSTRETFSSIPNFRNSVFSDTLEKVEHVIKKGLLRMYHKFKIAGMNKDENDRKIVAFILKNYVDEPPKVKLVHKPFISADGKNNDPHAVSVRVYLDKYKKWAHIGWIPNYNDDRSMPGPNKIVADWLDSENNPIKTVKFAELNSFRTDEGELMYYGVLLVVAETNENW